MEARRERYVVGVRANFSVVLSRHTTAPVQRADQVLVALSRWQWHTLRCWRVDGDGTRHPGWLIGKRPARGQTGEWRYFWSNFPPATPLPVMVEYVHRRHWVEQSHEEAKGLLG